LNYAESGSREADVVRHGVPAEEVNQAERDGGADEPRGGVGDDGREEFWTNT
jgi:hypothetical protein